MKIRTFLPEQTAKVGYLLGKRAVSGQVFALTGDLGTGKTVFSKGFAKGMGVTEAVTSPTFTIVSEYHDGRLPLYHFDVYRMADGDELEEIGLTEYFYSEGVCLVEWADKVYDVMPTSTITVGIYKNAPEQPEERQIILAANGLSEGAFFDEIKKDLEEEGIAYDPSDGEAF